MSAPPPAEALRRLCPVCGSSIADGSRYCERCGSRIPERFRPIPVGRYPFPRVQVDPGEDLPYIEARWVFLVLGVSLAVAGGFLLLVDGIVSAAAGGRSLFVDVFEIPGVALLVVGAALLIVGLWKTL